jgi:hypothetical protein
MNTTRPLQEIRIYLVAFSIAWISLSFLVGLFYSFEVLESSTMLAADTAFLVAIKVATPLILIGLVTFGIPLFVILRGKGKR